MVAGNDPLPPSSFVADYTRNRTIWPVKTYPKSMDWPPDIRSYIQRVFCLDSSTLAIYGFVVSLVAFAGEAVSQTHAFVGSPVGVETTDLSCMDYIEQDPDPNIEVICLDRVFRLRYRTEDSYFGLQGNPIVEFLSFYHYAVMPDYTIAPHLFLVLDERNGELVAVRRDEVTKKANGWWVCEDETCLYGDGNDCESGRLAAEIAAEIKADENSAVSR